MSIIVRFMMLLSLTQYMLSYHYTESYCGDKMVARLSYLCNGNSQINTMASGFQAAGDR